MLNSKTTVKLSVPAAAVVYRINATAEKRGFEKKLKQNDLLSGLCGLLYELCGWGFGERDFKLSLSKVYPDVGSPQLPKYGGLVLCWIVITDQAKYAWFQHKDGMELLYLLDRQVHLPLMTPMYICT